MCSLEPTCGVDCTGQCTAESACTDGYVFGDPDKCTCLVGERCCVPSE